MSKKNKQLALEIISDTFDRVNNEFEDLEADLIDGVLTIQDLDNKTYVISFHEPTSQIWYSSPLSGAHHFELKFLNNRAIFKDTRESNLNFPDFFFNEVKN